MIAALAALVSFGLVATITVEVNLSRGQDNAVLARNAAESAMAVAIKQLVHDTSFKDVVQQSQDGAVGIVSFGIARGPHGEPVIPSVNNIKGSSAQTAFNNLDVPPGCVLLVGNGFANGLQHSVEAILKFGIQGPFALVAPGAINLSDSQINAVQSVADLGNGAPGAGSVGSNTSLAISTSSEVTGNAVAEGQVSVDGSSVVQGQVQPSATPLTFPPFAIPTPPPGASPIPNRPSDELTLSNGAFVCNGSLNQLAGIQLNNAVLFVTQDCFVGGTLNGNGIIYVGGKATSTFLGQARPSDKIALVAGSASLIGRSQGFTESGPGQDLFHGIVMVSPGGTLRLHTFSMAGIAIGGSQVTANRAGVTLVPSLTTVSVTPTGGSPAGPPFPPPNQVIPSFPSVLTNSGGITMQVLNPNGAQSAIISVSTSYSVNPLQFFDPHTGQFTLGSLPTDSGLGSTSTLDVLAGKLGIQFQTTQPASLAAGPTTNIGTLEQPIMRFLTQRVPNPATQTILAFNQDIFLRLQALQQQLAQLNQQYQAALQSGSNATFTVDASSVNSTSGQGQGAAAGGAPTVLLWRDL
ncbi:MAG: hypothetical protein ACYCW6_05495 [Candidatus Xenobia bacterium]